MDVGGSTRRQSEQVPRAPQLAAFGCFAAVLSIGMTNTLRRRPVLYQPWLHLIAGMLGIYLGGRLGSLYDDVTDVANKQLEAYRIVPSWAFASLSPEEAEAQSKRQRLLVLHQKFADLAEIEEKDFQSSVGHTSRTPNTYFR